MKKLVRWVVLATVVGAPLAAQTPQTRGRPFEFGFDAMFSHTSMTGPGSASQSFSNFDFPLQGVHATVPLNSGLAIEPAVGWTTTSVSGGASTNDFSGDIGLLVDLTKSRRQPQWFLRPFVGLQHSSFTAGTGNTTTTVDRATFGLGAGLRVPATDRIAMRYEARYRYLTAADGQSGNVVGILAGVSISTR